ncbi:CDP-diacylglycerol--glycerol-3-phosphate 3-phosphatidyltransferase [PVC group bacterium (ex Bugula neritina AB1)]|nr:CDP-diacylglycerol--glycerol-3-phosphate 3-phosphatidyltransferase [PVC group bacterium (ex Bugula neritina AB1)]
MNGPNLCCLIRIGLAFIFLGLLMSFNVWAPFLALVVFLIACFTDFLDGYWARKANIKTKLGAMLDPLADKILMTVAFVSFVDLGYLEAWPVIFILTREFAVTGLRGMAIEKNILISASFWGKAKSCLQMFFVVMVTVFHCQLLYKKEWIPVEKFLLIIDLFLFVVLLATFLSGWRYFSDYFFSLRKN